MRRLPARLAAPRLAFRLVGRLAVGAALLAAGCREGAEEARRPNVVLLVIDTLRADHLSGYGYGRETSPNLDRLMAEGVRFDAAISPSSWSAPAHATIATGAAEYRHGVLGFQYTIAPGVEPLAVPLRRAGYATGLFSTHLSLHGSVGRLDEGVDEKLVLRNTEDERVLAAALAWALEQERPFFLYTCLMTPHAPYTKYPRHYDRKLFLDTPPGGERAFPFTDEAWVGRGAIPRSVRVGDQRSAGYYVNRYDRGVRWADELVGRFWRGLEQAGLGDDTLLVAVSDHGEGLGDNGCFAHEYYLYDFLVRVPFFVRYPGRVPAGTWKPQVALADVVPTILGLLRLPVPESLDGRDHSAHLRLGTRPDEERLTESSYRFRGFERYMVRSSRFKLVLDAGTGEESLYDLARDPGETRDLLAEPDGAGLGREAVAALATLRAAMEDYRARHAAAGAAGPDVPLTDEVREELRALGYLED